MSKIGYTYGSEWHPLRYLGYHRDILNRAVEVAIPGSTVRAWLGQHFEERPVVIDGNPPRFLDREFEGIDFLPGPEQGRLRKPLGDFWPTTGSLPNWDAIGRLELQGQASWPIVEAKSHVGELDSICKARGQEDGIGSSGPSAALRTTWGSRGMQKPGWDRSTSSATGWRS